MRKPWWDEILLDGHINIQANVEKMQVFWPWSSFRMSA